MCDPVFQLPKVFAKYARYWSHVEFKQAFQNHDFLKFRAFRPNYDTVMHGSRILQRN